VAAYLHHSHHHDYQRMALVALMNNTTEVLTCDAIKAKAHRILLEETFIHIEQDLDERYFNLAKDSAIARGTTASFFMYNGEVYPKRTTNGTVIRTVKVVAPPLHYSLYDRFSEIAKYAQQINRTSVANFFSAVLSLSAHEIVLDELLPSVLTGVLRQKLGSDAYQFLNAGHPPFQKRTESLELTKANIVKIKEHYAETISYLREILVEQLLLVK